MSWVEWKKIDIGIFTGTSYKFPWTCACLMWKNIIMLIHRQTYICIIMCFNKNTCNQKKWKHIFAHLGWVQKLLKTKELYWKHFKSNFTHQIFLLFCFITLYSYDAVIKWKHFSALVTLCEGSTVHRLISLTVVSDTELWPSLCLWMFCPHEGQTIHRHTAAHRDCFVKAFSIHSNLINIVIPLTIIVVSISYLWN